MSTETDIKGNAWDDITDPDRLKEILVAAAYQNDQWQLQCQLMEKEIDKLKAQIMQLKVQRDKGRPRFRLVEPETLPASCDLCDHSTVDGSKIYNGPGDLLFCGDCLKKELEDFDESILLAIERGDDDEEAA